MNLLSRLGKLLRVPTDEVESVLRTDERRARETVSRRRFMGTAAALASAPFVPQVWALPLRDKVLVARWIEDTMAQRLTEDWSRYDTGQPDVLVLHPATYAAIERLVIKGRVEA